MPTCPGILAVEVGGGIVSTSEHLLFWQRLYSRTIARDRRQGAPAGSYRRRVAPSNGTMQGVKINTPSVDDGRGLDDHRADGAEIELKAQVRKGDFGFVRE